MKKKKKCFQIHFSKFLSKENLKLNKKEKKKKNAFRVIFPKFDQQK